MVDAAHDGDADLPPGVPGVESGLSQNMDNNSGSLGDLDVPDIGLPGAKGSN